MNKDSKKFRLHGTLAGILAWMLTSLVFAADAPAEATPQELREAIRTDPRLAQVKDRAAVLMKSGFTAGEHYGEIWIRDFNTFMDLACSVHSPELIREKLSLFFHFQGEDGNIVDGLTPADATNVAYKYIHSETQPDFAAHKNTVETDQESSLVLAVCRYAELTGSRDFFQEEISGEKVIDRLDAALLFLTKHRFDAEHGLVWGATTADWGDVQPEHEWGVVLDESSHRAIDIYDNALFLSAIQALLDSGALPPDRAQWWRNFHKTLAENTRKHLWDSERKKFRPHIYLEGSPFPADFDEDALYYHGGTAVAIEAGLLTPAEVKDALEAMRRNVRDAGAATIGLTIYPPYPAGLFKNPGMGPYSYQNGGDWTWFGARMIHQLIRHGYIEDALRELSPMIDRVLKNDGFYEWYSVDNKPRGSGAYRGEAGVLYRAIVMLEEWAGAPAQG